MFNNAFKERRLIVDLCCIFFGISCWVEINGLWIQTPILVNALPEGWKLTSYIALLIQLANIGPFLFGIFSKKLKPYEEIIIHITYLIGTVSCICLSLLWKTTIRINGNEHSVSFLAFSTLLALVDCTSSVLYVPYMAHFKSKYLMSFMIGEGLSGLVPSLVSFFQGIGGSPACVDKVQTIGNITTVLKTPAYSEPKFSVSLFCVFLTIIIMLSWLFFTLLGSSLFKTERLTKVKSNNSLNIPNAESDLISIIPLKKKSIIHLLAIQTYACALTNGILPALQSYSCQPYGQTTYHLTVRFASLASLTACFCTFYFKKKISIKLVNYVAIFSLLFIVYIIFTAVSSPHPPLQNKTLGSILILVSWILKGSSFSFMKASIASILRDFSKEGHRALFWYGSFTQIGSAVGAMVTFLLINYTSIFKSYNPCEL